MPFSSTNKTEQIQMNQSGISRELSVLEKLLCTFQLSHHREVRKKKRGEINYCVQLHLQTASPALVCNKMCC